MWPCTPLIRPLLLVPRVAGVHCSYMQAQPLEAAWSYINNVVQVVRGGLFLRPIPGHMLQTAEVTPQVMHDCS